MTRTGALIKQLRARNGYTQEKLADVCDVSRQAVAKWESGASLPDTKNLILLADLFQVSTDRLLMRKGGGTGTDAKPETETDFAENERLVNQALKISMTCEDPEDEINRFISFIGEQSGCDRMYIFEEKSDGNYSNTYEWCGQDVSPQIEYLQNIPLEDITIWLDIFSKGDHIIIRDLEELASTSPIVYRWLKPQGIHSLVAYPLFDGKSFIGVDNPTEEFISQTSSLIEIMVHFTETMIQRRNLIKELKLVIFQNNLVNSLSSGVRYQLNIASGKIKLDAESLKNTDYSLKENLSLNLEDIISGHPEFHDHLMLDGIERAIHSRKNTSIEFVSYRDKGKLRWNRITLCPFIDIHGEVHQLYGILQDTSKEHPVIGQYNKYISKLSGGMHICYLSEPSHLEYASDELCSFLGYTPEEFQQIVGSVYTNVILEEDRGIFRSYYKSLAAAPGLQSCEYRMVRKDGSIVHVVDTMESVTDDSGITYGYAHVLDRSELHTILNMAETAEKKHLALINKQYEVLEALGKDYLNIFRVWLDEDRAQIVSLNGYVTKGMVRGSSEYLPYYHFCMQYIQDRVHPEDREKMLEAMHPDTVRRVLSKEDEYLVVYRTVEDGETHFCQMKCIRLGDEAGSKGIRFVAGFKNIDRITKAMQFAYWDSLTGVMNRNAFERDFDSLDNCRTAGFIYCDLNKLKHINDTKGHSRGDLLLIKFAEILKKYFSVNCLYRIGGDEFLCMLGNIDKKKFSERTSELFAELEKSDNIAAAGISYGSTKQKKDLLREAEINMYVMKSGKAPQPTCRIS